jgi:hypothetical protein
MAKNNYLASVEVALKSGKLSREDVLQLLEKAPEKQQSSVFHSYDQMKNAPPVRFVIKDFLQAEGATIFGGPSGHDKTWATIATMKALLSGELLFDYFEVVERAEKVIYLAPEINLGQAFYRLCKKFKLDEYIKSGQLLVSTLSIGRRVSMVEAEILRLCKDADIFLDTLPRFRGEGKKESEADGNQELANQIFNLLAQGARSVNPLQHSPKNFINEKTMQLETLLRGSGDIGAMASTVWGFRRLTAADDQTRNLVYVQNVKPRDFLPPEPFVLRLRPDIDDRGLIGMEKKPGECESMEKEIAGCSGTSKPGKKAWAKTLFEQDQIISRRLLNDRIKAEYGSGVKDKTLGSWLNEWKGTQGSLSSMETFDETIGVKQ